MRTYVHIYSSPSVEESRKGLRPFSRFFEIMEDGTIKEQNQSRPEQEKITKELVEKIEKK